MTILFDYEADEKLSFAYETLIGEVIDAAMDYEEFPYESEINVVITDNEGIHQVNKEFREMDKATDVLSFPMVEYEEAGAYEDIENHDEYFHPDSGELLLGDYMISVDKVKIGRAHV